jgi:ATP-dependent DNA ligase
MVIKAKDGIYEPGKRPTTNLKAKQVDFADAIIIGFESPTKEYYGQELETWGYNILEDDDETDCRLQGTYADLCEKFLNQKVVAVTKPYYYKWFNARMKIGAYDENGNIKEIGVIHSGITDEMKKDMTENPQNYLNKVVKIQCMSLDKKEKTIRHGFYKGLHSEKNPQECTLKDIFS